MHRFARAPIWKVLLGLWLLAAGLAPGVCAALCSTNTCPTCAPAYSKAIVASPCCGHCSKATHSVHQLTAGAERCCCKNPKGIAQAAVKPTKATLASVVAPPALAVPPQALPDQVVVLGVVAVPEYVAGTPPKPFLTCTRARAPPTLRV
jgi:hypothetical protein